MSPQENVVVQTTAVATGTVSAIIVRDVLVSSPCFAQMPLAAGFVGIIPALGLLEEDKDGSSPVQLSWISAVLWSGAVAYFGYDCSSLRSYAQQLTRPSIQRVFMSPPLRKQVVRFNGIHSVFSDCRNSSLFIHRSLKSSLLSRLEQLQPSLFLYSIKSPLPTLAHFVIALGTVRLNPKRMPLMYLHQRRRWKLNEKKCGCERPSPVRDGPPSPGVLWRQLSLL